MVRALSAGKLSSCREGAQISGIRTCLLAEDGGPKQGLSQKLLASVVHTLICRDYSQRDPGNKMASPGVLAKPTRAGRTDVLWKGRCLVFWSLKQGLPQKLSSRDLWGVLCLLTQVTRCWRRPEGTCDPGQARFSASLMLSQVPCDWIETEVVFHSPEVLRSH